MARGVRDLQLQELKDTISQLNTTISAQTTVIVQLQKTLQDAENREAVNVNEKVYHSLAKNFTTLLAKNFTIFPFSLVNKFTSSAIEKVYHSRYRKSLPPSILLWGIPQ